MRMLARTLENCGIETITTREPGGTPTGEHIRALMVSGESAKMTPTTELLLMAASRAQHVAEVIRPGVEAGGVVISDRHTDSTVAFQGYGRGLNLAMIDELNNFATKGFAPDLTILFDLEPETAQRRRGARPVGGLLGALDEEKLDFHRRVREGYLNLAAGYPDRIRTINASGSVEETHKAVLSLVLPLVEKMVSDA